MSKMFEIHMKRKLRRKLLVRLAVTDTGRVLGNILMVFSKNGSHLKEF